MKRALSTRHGFFALAAIVSFAMLLVIEPQFRWVCIGLGGLYVVLALAFFAEHVTRGR
jgi:hypothetical protein